MKRFFMCLFLLLVVFGIEFIRSNYTLGVTHHILEINDLPAEFENYRIVQLSDLHSKKFLQLPQKIQKEHPDLVVMTGDMVNSIDRDFSEFLNIAQEIAKQYPTYFIVGNHEQALPRASFAELITRLTDAGVKILDNQAERICQGNSAIHLYGLWFNLRYYRDKNDVNTKDYVVRQQELEKILGKASQDTVNILLAHNPVYLNAYQEWGADVVLAGHMHGGMIRIPFRGGLFSPEKEYFPKYDAGLFQKKGTQMVVSRGLGEHTGFRFWNQPEIIVIDLTKKSA